MPDDLIRTEDIEAYIARLHDFSTDDLGQNLQQILGAPASNLPFLRVFAAEVGLMVTRVMFLRDYGAVTAFIGVLEGPLAQAGPQGSALASLADAPPAVRGEITYYLGRLMALLVSARRFLLLDCLERLRAEYLDGGLEQDILVLLREGGPRNPRAIATALRARPGGGLRIKPQDVQQVLKRLVKDELVAQKAAARAATPTLELTQLGLQLLEETPPWMEDVEEAYRSYRRLQVGGVSTETRRSLLKLFLRLDREAGQQLPEPAPAPSQRRYPFVDADRLPPQESRGLPRIFP